ncbi:hypothetical protein PV417_24845 [Streptomyces sp. ME19-03-3]|nr:hypothetical protein [Streptomyces sp. ME19-03-3]
MCCNHPNPRTGDVDAIAESLRVNGRYKAIVVNRGTHTGRPNEVLAGVAHAVDRGDGRHGGVLG